MPYIIIARTGDRPLHIQGERIAYASSASKRHQRWHVIELYRESGGRYLVYVGYHTRWEGEHDHNYAELVDSADAVAEALKAYDPCAHLIGYPPSPAYAAKQERLRQQLRAQYQAIVSEALAGFAETV